MESRERWPELDRTAVVRNHDGSFASAARVQPCSGYKVMMQRLSHEASKHPRYITLYGWTLTSVIAIASIYC